MQTLTVHVSVITALQGLISPSHQSRRKELIPLVKSTYVLGAQGTPNTGLPLSSLPGGELPLPGLKPLLSSACCEGFFTLMLPSAVPAVSQAVAVGLLPSPGPPTAARPDQELSESLCGTKREITYTHVCALVHTHTLQAP